jgi:hypothetical protein
MSIQRASKQEFKSMVNLWESKGHQHVVKVTFEANGMTMFVPCYGDEQNSIFLVVDSVLPDPIDHSAMFSPTTRHGIKDSNDQCHHVLSNRARCKNWVKGDSSYCAKHSLAEN